MASMWTTEGLYQIAKGTIDWEGDTLKIMLLNDEALAAKTVVNVSEIVADEFSGTGYTGGFNGAGRKSLASKTVTKDAGNARVVFDAADPSAWTLDGDDVQMAAIIKEITNDGASIVLCFIDSNDITANGGQVTVSFSANGILRLHNNPPA